MVKGTFEVSAASSPCFRPGVAAIHQILQETCARIVSYGALLLTMIKVVLIAAISKASLNQ
jgi:hypothetical protein